MHTELEGSVGALEPETPGLNCCEEWSRSYSIVAGAEGRSITCARTSAEREELKLYISSPHTLDFELMSL